MKVLYHHRTSVRDGSAVHINALITALRDVSAEPRIVAPSIPATHFSLRAPHGGTLAM